MKVWHSASRARLSSGPRSPRGGGGRRTSQAAWEHAAALQTRHVSWSEGTSRCGGTIEFPLHLQTLERLNGLKANVNQAVRTAGV
ncbi:hypothetical protein EYF80_043564 [Liparis tanakae]|uniref:Uncharacterized protein n=1 Tax=Liparis tanakae TaxID=230148 RepID=A0A4Z2FZ41_9TELE|nr:hypothetical protein EYF80_043564 [Liparis tanakae]